MERMEAKLRKSVEINISIQGRGGNLVERSRDLPLLVLGDLHGETDSLDLILDRFREVEKVILFLGDYVDRGKDSLGLLSVLFELQARNPEGVILLRGNHEDWRMNLRYGFARELQQKGGEDLYPFLLKWYESLPLVARIGEVLALHGGIPFPIPENLEELRNIQFPEEGAMHILWSDPEDDIYCPRGAGTRSFNDRELEEFLELVGCELMLRGHQYCPEEGYKINFGKCITLFSASYGRGWPRSAFYLPMGPIEKDLESYIFTF